MIGDFHEICSTEEKLGGSSTMTPNNIISGLLTSLTKRVCMISDIGDQPTLGQTSAHLKI